MESCVVCLVQFRNSQKDISLVKTGNESRSRKKQKLSLAYREILRIFCQYFNLPCKQKIKGNENRAKAEKEEESESGSGSGILPPFPFCMECRKLVAELCIFHDKIEYIQTRIEKIIAKITMKIINTEKENHRENSDCSNSDSDSDSKSDSDSLEHQNHVNEAERKNNTDTDLFGYRRKIVQNFNPRVHLTDCQNRKKQNQNQKKEENEARGRNEVNSIETTNFEAAEKVISPESKSKSESNNFQDQDIENENTTKSLASLSLHEKPKSARTTTTTTTRASLMRTTRSSLKLNTQSKFPPLENSVKPEKAQENSGQLKYTCGKCPRRFSYAFWCKKHEETHDELICPKCAKKFPDKSTLQTHLDRHNKVMKFLCPVCNSGFLQKWELDRHKEIRAHLKTRRQSKTSPNPMKEESLELNPEPNSNPNSKSNGNGAQKSKRKRKTRDESSNEEEEEAQESTSENEREDDEPGSVDSNATTEED